MLAHLPGRTSQPSRKGVTSNFFILQCSFHKTAKRLSITSLTHLLRLRSKIQSSIVSHNKMSVLVIPVILLQIRSITNLQKNPILSVLWQYSSLTTIQKKALNCQNQWQNFRLPSNGDTKITDWITSQKPICRRHPINLNNNIKDISQQKRSAKKR